MDNFLKEFLDKLAWPAVAGNVSWSFVSLILGGCSLEVIPRALSLLVFSIYPFAEWYRTEIRAKKKNSGSSVKSLGLYLDALLAILVVWFAIATQNGNFSSAYALIGFLGVVAIGHGLGAWPPAGKGQGNAKQALVCALGAGTLLVVRLGGYSWYDGIQVLVLLLVFGVWLSNRRLQV